MADSTMIEEAFDTARKLQWNIKSEKDDIVVYNNTPEKIMMVWIYLHF